MKRIFVVLLAMSLSACGPDSVFLRTEKPVVVVPDHDMFTCDSVVLPNPDTLTIIQTAKLIVELKTALDTCKNNMSAVEEYLKKAKAKLESR